MGEPEGENTNRAVEIDRSICPREGVSTVLYCPTLINSNNYMVQHSSTAAHGQQGHGGDQWFYRSPLVLRYVLEYTEYTVQ